MLDPERGMQQRIVLLRGANLRPDAPESVRRSQLREGDVTEVVPQRPAVNCRPVGGQRRDEDETKQGGGPFGPPPHRLHVERCVSFALLRVTGPLRTCTGATSACAAPSWRTSPSRSSRWSA